MNEKFFNRFRIPSARMRNWDYRWNAPYFITICTQKRTCYFGKIIDDKMDLSEIGKIAQQYWIEIPTHFPYVHLGEFVIMPNHVHGIVIIDKKSPSPPALPFTDNSKNKFMGDISPKIDSLSTIIRSYKSAVSKEIHHLGYDFAWQTRYYDHIIRNHESYVRIEQYIENNPMKWIGDNFFEC